MAVTDQQKLDFLLKKIGYTKTKTGSVVGTGAISGTPKQPFAEAIPSPLVVPNSSLWNEAGSIPATPPGSDTPQVKVYLAATSGLRMTADSTSSGQRAYIAYSTYGNTSSARLTNWIDTQFGASYLIKVYKGDPNSGGVALSAAGSGSNDGWFFDYSAGVLNFNDTSVPSGVTDTNIYIVGYRYIGQTGAPTSGISTFSNLDLTVERNLDVGKQGGISTFRHNVQLLDNDKLQFGNSQDLSIYHNGTNSYIEDSNGSAHLNVLSHRFQILNQAGNESMARFYANGAAELYYDNNLKFATTSTGINVTGDGVFSGNVSIGGTLTYEDVKNVDAVGLITARSGIRVTGGVIEAQAGENKIPSLYSNMGALPSAGSYHGMFAHVHATGRGYFAHAGNWLELVNREINGVVGTGTETYNIGNLVSTSSTATSLNVSGVTTTVTLDVNGDLDVDGHTNLDNLSVAGVSTFSENVRLLDNDKLQFGDSQDLSIFHDGNHTYINKSGSGTGNLYFNIDQVSFLNTAGNKAKFDLFSNGQAVIYHDHSQKFTTTSTGIDITGNVVSDGLVVDGNSDLNGDLDVDGHTNLDNVSIAGVTTTSGLLDINAGGQANTFKVEDLTSGRVVLAGTGGELEDNNNLTFDGTNLFVSGINVTGGGATSILGADIVTRNLKATGVSTFVGDVQFDSGIKAGGSTGSNGQYLKTTGSGVEWATFPTLRTRQTFTASSGQTTFSFSYTINFIDVFVNGIKLTDAEFTATNGSTVVLAVGCFVGDIVELVSYNTVSGGGGGGGGISNVVEDTTPQLGGNLDLFNKSITGTGNVNITGIITATNFVGDGSGLTGITASGSGVIVKDSGSTVGTAGTINFGDNLSVTPASAGIVTVGVSSASFNVNRLNVTGITTFVGITTFTNEVSFRPPLFGKVNFYGSVEGQRLRWQNNGSNVGLYFNNGVVSYYGDDVRTQISPHGNGGSSDHFRVWQYRPDGKENQFQLSSDFINIIGAQYNSHQQRDIAKINYDDGASFYHFGNKKFQTSGVGVTITSQLDVTNINASGVTTTTEVRSNALSLKNAAGSATYATFSNGGASVLKWNNTDRLETTTSGVTVTGTVAATSYTGDGSQLTGITAGISTISGVVNIVNDLDVDGHTNLDNVSVSGIITAPSVDIDGGSIDNTNIGFNVPANAVFGNVTINQLHTVNGAIDLNGDLDVDGHTNLDNVTIAGVCTATNFVGDGSGLTNVIGSGSGVVVKDSGSTVGTAGTINFANGLDVTDISAGIVTVSTATTALSAGNSKVFVNSESSSTNNGSFEVFLQDNTSSGAGHTAFKIYQPADNQNKVEFFSNNFALTSTLDLNCGFAGNAGNTIRFKTNGAYNFTSSIHVGTSKAFEFKPDGSNTTVQFSETSGSYFKTRIQPYGSDPVDLGTSSNKFSQFHVTGVNAGVVTATTFHGDGSNLTGISGGGGTDVGITTNLSGTFTASAGTPATINTFAYHDNDKVVEYTVYIKNGSDFQSQKLLAMRDGTTIHSTQFAVMFSSSLLVQCDATISSGNILLRATPETGVSGSTTYKIKREVM